MFIAITSVKDYLHAVKLPFFKSVFGVEPNEEFYTSVVDHMMTSNFSGTEFHQQWAEANFNQYRATAVYMLTFIHSLYPGYKKDGPWVMEKYEEYEPILIDIENDLGI